MQNATVSTPGTYTQTRITRTRTQDEASDDEMDMDEEDEEDFKDGAVLERSDRQERANVDDQVL